MIPVNVISCCRQGANGKIAPGEKSGLLSSGRKIAPSGVGIWPRRRTIMAAMAVSVLLPIEVGNASWLSDVFKGSPKHEKSPAHAAAQKHATVAKRAASPKPHNVKLAALGPAGLNAAGSKPAASSCNPSKFRIVRDVGHTAEAEGASSSRNVAEFVFNLRLARRIEEKLKGEGFT